MSQRQPLRVDEAAEGSSANERAAVLVVDDELSIAQLITWTLKDAGMDVRHAASGQSALDAIYEWKPNLILLDLELPDINGREVYARLRAAGVRVPVLIISAYGARRAQRMLGADGAIEKPFDPQFMLERVEHLLAEAR